MSKAFVVLRVLGACVFIVSQSCLARSDYKQNFISQDEMKKASKQHRGTTVTGVAAVAQTMAEIAEQHEEARLSRCKNMFRQSHPVYRNPLRAEIQQFPQALQVASFPAVPEQSYDGELTRKPQVVSTSFLAGSLEDTGIFPPDSMGAVGPSQFLLTINGLIRSFNKTTGLADGVMNFEADTFFNPVRNGEFTTDPRCRYDRFSDRWIILMINTPDTENNRIMIAVSDNGTISFATVWSYFFIDVGTDAFFDYPTLGVDVNALYIGGVTFSETNSGKLFVVKKSSILGAGPIVYTVFNNVIDFSTAVGPYVPQGVDNFDPGATEGYFIGVDNAYFGRLILRRVSNPGGTPTLSGNIPLAVPATRLPLQVEHKGNDNTRTGLMDGIDDRLFMAHIRNNRLWTVHNLAVNNKGVCVNSSTRNGSRWYEINVGTPAPTLVQFGTLYDASKQNTTDRRSYWVPAIMTSGQGHMTLCSSFAGKKDYIGVAAAGRLVGDVLGRLQDVTIAQKGNGAYNPESDEGESFGRRWGDYSYTSVDPSDDMTMWTIQEYCDDDDFWGVRAIKLLAPPPATPFSASPASVAQGTPSTNVTITGLVPNGAGFFDPGVGFVNHISAAVTGGVTVNSVTYNSPSSVTLNISTVGATTGAKNVTVTNPDGQSKVGTGILTIT